MLEDPTGTCVWLLHNHCPTPVTRSPDSMFRTSSHGSWKHWMAHGSWIHWMAHSLGSWFGSPGLRNCVVQILIGA
ncbi:hypothetical protein Hamer_G030507 [Homarus americanus]|uniref:Uncharacterized protein n=1 Tax=Homarus americanus TaxID=6706 RepID=A0A8J5JZG7_HOMAM|nr:hypothetical protein Hamer_G003440 [Homarus americanus]KAG7164562.1 hypothetical protein Hamer_G030507 [Homarus americanus]